MARPKKKHWYRGEQDKGLVVCGKGANRVDWTDREDVWGAAENKCTTCDEKR